MLSILFLLGMTFSAYSETCPSAEEIEPCSCHEMLTPGHIYVGCEYDESSNSDQVNIANSLNSLKGKKNIELVLSGVNMTHVPSDIFEGMGITRLALYECAVPEVKADEEILVDLKDSLKELTIEYSITENDDLSKLRLGHLRNLKILTLSFNTIPEVTNSWFENSNLEEIYLAKAGIKKLGDRVFAGLSNLKVLQLNLNDLDSVKRSMLPTSATNELTSLGLVSTNIERLENDIFSNMPSLKVVTLSSNKISTLERDTWEAVWEQLDLLDLTKNPVQCDSSQNWTFDLHRPHNIRGQCEGPENWKGRSIQNYIDTDGQLKNRRGQ